MFWEFLKEFGFSSYELKALQGLLRLGTGSPSDISEAENIPSSKIYSALDRLESAGLIVKVDEDNIYRLADQYQIVATLGELQKQKSQEFSDSLGNLAKYLSHQSHSSEKETYSIVSGSEQIKQKLILASLEAPHDLSIYWNTFNQRDLNVLIEFIQYWEEAKRNYVDRILLHSSARPEIDIPSTRKINLRYTDEFKGNSLVLWGQQQVGIIIASPIQSHALGMDISSKQLSEEYLAEFENWWFSARTLGQN